MPQLRKRSVFVRLLRYAKPYWPLLALALVLAAANVLLELARPWAIRIVVDYGLSDDPEPAWLESVRSWLPGAETSEGLIVWTVAAVVAMIAVGFVLSLAVLYLTVGVGRRTVYDLSRDMFTRLQRLSISFHGRSEVGDLMQRATNDVFVAFGIVSQITFPLAVAFLTLGGMFVIMISIDPLLTVVALAVVPALLIIIAAFHGPMDRTTTEQYARWGSLMALVEQTLYGIKAIQGFARERYVQERLETEARELSETYYRSTKVTGAYSQATSSIIALGAAGLLGFGAIQVLHGELTVGELLVFLAYLTALYAPIASLSEAVGASLQISARGRRVFEILDSDDEVPERPDARIIRRPEGEVAFDDVSFGYGDPEQGASPALLGITFTASPGQVTAIVGATGAGKTSLVSLIPRLFDPWGGRVLLDGQDLRTLTLQSLRENVALVLQDPFLFPLSIRDNIAFGRPDAKFYEIVEAARTARAHEFVKRLPDGYETVIAEKGGSLSGGERQRIAIARAVLKDAPILILDEPTSAVDAVTEMEILSAIEGLMEGRTTIVISHRLSTIVNADQIIALEHGVIVERGTHASLLEHGRLYPALYSHQYVAPIERVLGDAL